MQSMDLYGETIALYTPIPPASVFQPPAPASAPPSRPTTHPLDLTRPLHHNDLKQVLVPDTFAYEEFITLADGVEGFRQHRSGPAAENAEIEQRCALQFVGLEEMYKQRWRTDPRIAYRFGELLMTFEDYLYSEQVLVELASVLDYPSPAIENALEVLELHRIALLQEGLQAYDQLPTSQISWAYSTRAIDPLPNLLHPLPPLLPQIQISNVTAEEREFLFRAMSIHTNLIEGIFDLLPQNTNSLIDLSFAPSTFHQMSGTKTEHAFVRNVLEDSLKATRAAFDRIGNLPRGPGQPLVNVDFMKELHNMFTRTACLISYGNQGDRINSLLGRGRIKLKSNHVFARTGKYHLYCPPTEVESELGKLFEMLRVYLAVPNTSMEYGIWLAAWFHHRFVNIHPFTDGNGRVTRLMTSVILAKFNLLPMFVSLYDKDDYISALMHADSGNLSPLAKFISRQQLHAFFLAKSRTPTTGILPATMFRSGRHYEATTLISTLLKNLLPEGFPLAEEGEAPSTNIRTLEKTIYRLGSNAFLSFGSLKPRSADIFVVMVITPCGASGNHFDQGSVRLITAVTYKEPWSSWEERLTGFVKNEIVGFLGVELPPK